ncbi:MAG: organic solvent tolerance protein OstA [Negativicutes bacterium]|nr:organic solvent tolerance protein OstA [Negativicutes bacterium]
MKPAKTIGAVAAAIILATASTGIYAAQKNSPVELTADTIEYDSVQGIMVAQGGIRLTQDTAIITGAKAEYNTKTKEAYVAGGVKAVDRDATLTAAEIRAYGNSHLIASGDAELVKGDSRLTGPKVEYFTDREYAQVAGPARLATPDSVMTAGMLEAFIREDRAVGKGNVHIVSDKHKLDATADQATYYGAKAQESPNKVILSGNARAVQDGNTLTGNTLTIYLDDKAMQADGGRNKLVIRPQ